MLNEPERINGHLIISEGDDAETGLSDIIKVYRSMGLTVDAEMMLYNQEGNCAVFLEMIEKIAQIGDGCLIEPLVSYGFLKKEMTNEDDLFKYVDSISERDLQNELGKSLSHINKIFKMIENMTRVTDSLETRYVKQLAQCADALIIEYDKKVDKGVSNQLMLRYLNH